MPKQMMSVLTPLTLHQNINAPNLPSRVVQSNKIKNVLLRRHNRRLSSFSKICFNKMPGSGQSSILQAVRAKMPARHGQWLIAFIALL